MHTNQQLIERYFEAVWSSGDRQAQEQLIAEEYVGYWLIAGMPVRQGRASHNAWVETVRNALPDARYTVHEVIVDQDRAMARVTLGGTHLGMMAGRPPTGRYATADQIFVFHLADGQIRAEWVSFDRESFMKQLEAAEPA